MEDPILCRERKLINVSSVAALWEDFSKLHFTTKRKRYQRYTHSPSDLIVCHLCWAEAGGAPYPRFRRGDGTFSIPTDNSERFSVVSC